MLLKTVTWWQKLHSTALNLLWTLPAVPTKDTQNQQNCPSKQNFQYKTSIALPTQLKLWNLGSTRYSNFQHFTAKNCRPMFISKMAFCRLMSNSIGEEMIRQIHYKTHLWIRFCHLSKHNLHKLCEQINTRSSLLQSLSVSWETQQFSMSPFTKCIITTCLLIPVSAQWTQVFILCYMNEYLNPWYILAETGTRRHVIMMHFGNSDKPNDISSIYHQQTFTKWLTITVQWTNQHTAV